MLPTNDNRPARGLLDVVRALVGNEHQGLPPEMQALCDLIVRIPMAGRCDSLNVAVSAGIVLYEIFSRSAAAAISGSKEEGGGSTAGEVTGARPVAARSCAEAPERAAGVSAERS